MYSWCPAYSSLSGRGITSISHSGVEVHSNANLSWLSQAIDISTHKSALPYLGKDCSIYQSVRKRVHGNNVPPSRHIDRVGHGIPFSLLVVDSFRSSSYKLLAEFQQSMLILTSILQRLRLVQLEG